jgi:uncharacterized membrane protein
MSFSPPISPARKVRGTLDVLAGVLVIAAYVVLLQGQVAEGSFDPGKHFAYLTNQTSYSNIVVLLAGGILAWRRHSDTVLYATVRANFVAYAFVVGVVYNALLREPDHFGFHNEVTHVVIPIYFVADWLLRGHRPRIGWNTVWIGVSYPIVWVGITLLRAPFVEWYPYFFLNPEEVGGWSGVTMYVAAITAIFAILITAMVWINHLHLRKVARRGPLSSTPTLPS